MRFFLSYTYHDKYGKDFQFSLWDSFLHFKPDRKKEQTFNSLYEIRDYFELIKTGKKQNFQFSLWDSYKGEGLIRVNVFDFQFSLWDSHDKVTLFVNFLVLSILFMRFNVIPNTKSAYNTLLSILFMRFKDSVLDEKVKK